MHKLEGDSDGLLMRLFYPTLPTQELVGMGYQYAKWMPHKRYLKGHFSFRRSWFPGLMTFVTSLITGECLRGVCRSESCPADPSK